MLFRDLNSPTLIVLKGLLFFGCVLLSALGLCLETMKLSTVAFVVVLVWASARSYYFLFYVLHRYVDPGLTYSGLWSIVQASRREPTPPINSPTPPPSACP